MRHNFVSSSNAWGYRPQYWQLRTKNGAVSQKCDDVVEDGDSCIGPRYFDPPTNEENDQLIHMFMQSSVMDYAGENTQDMIGLGAYDFAAVRMFYGENVAVHADNSYRVWQPRGKGMLSITDTFWGILGYQHQSTTNPGNYIHYSELQNEYGLINPATCVEVDPDSFKPARWNEQRDGVFHPVIDARIVAVDGVYKKCRGQNVDYVSWEQMRGASPDESEYTTGVSFSFYPAGSPAVDRIGRTRVPYAFATDRWADLGNLAVYRHDNGADAYELFNFFITEQETRHIFDNYRRNKQSFSVRSASSRIQWRYNDKMRDGAKGLGLLINLNAAAGSADEVFAAFASDFPENVLAAGIAFDHFTRQIARPQSGPHFTEGSTYQGWDEFSPGAPVLNVPDGASGYFGNVGMGGKLIENRLAEGRGEFDADYTMNAGSYYDKIYAPLLLTESVDNFISDSLEDFVDARARNVSMADMFPDGFRRMLGNMLTTDEALKGAKISATAEGTPKVDFQSKFPTRPIGWTSWWANEVCFPAEISTVCSTPGIGGDFGEADIDSVATLRAQVGWEEWKFFLVQTMLYLPENAKNYWLDQLGIWEVGADSDPGFPNRIELHVPDGRVYVARTYGREEVLGKMVEKGIAARVLEQANELMELAYGGSPAAPGVTVAGPGAIDTDDDGINDSFLDEDGDLRPDLTIWYVPVYDESGVPVVSPSPGSGLNFNNYYSLVTYIRQVLQDFRMADPTMKGIYD
jgi:hypothetical protein